LKKKQLRPKTEKCAQKCEISPNLVTLEVILAVGNDLPVKPRHSGLPFTDLKLWREKATIG
jgi:hypothetical protein